VFTVAFALLVAVRAFDPAVHPGGGEKFLDFGLLKSLTRAGALPPEDPWFADAPVKYYYGGHLLAWMLTKLTGTAPRFGYNLALSGFYAMLVTGAYGLAGTIAARADVSRRAGGAFGAFFTGIASNLTTPGRLLVWLAPDGMGTWLATALGFELKGLALGPDRFSYWTASRVIVDHYDGNDVGMINEFPLFAWLNGDLHAHMMSTPFLLVVVAVLCSYFLTPEDRLRRRRLLVVGVLPPLAGMLAVVNTWSFPSVGGLTVLTLALAPADPTSLLPDRLAGRLRTRTWYGREGVRLVVALAAAGFVLALGVGWSLPFWLGTASGRGIALFPDRSSMGELLAVHGAFVAVFVPYVLRHALPALSSWHRWSLAGVVGVSALAWLSGAAVVALVGPLLAAGWLLLRETNPSVAVDGGSFGRETTGDRIRAAVGFETVLLLAGAGLVFIVEFAYVKEQAGPWRMNTMFKTYMQVWVLWAVAAGGMLARLVYDHSPDLALTGGRWRSAFRVLAAVLVVSTSVYGAFALSSHFDGRHPGPDEATLDAKAFVWTDHPEEAPAIRWLDANVEGQPNMLSAPGVRIYRWANPASSLTGIPTVAGWIHEVGYRGREAYFERVEDVETMYTGETDEQRTLLREYDVEYVYVGPAERDRYEEITVTRVEGVSVAKEFDHVTVYRVEQSEL
jgi:YYY domain-containing protein